LGPAKRDQVIAEVIAEIDEEERDQSLQERFAELTRKSVCSSRFSFGRSSGRRDSAEIAEMGARNRQHDGGGSS
jgi:hypothetical protein